MHGYNMTHQVVGVSQLRGTFLTVILKAAVMLTLNTIPHDIPSPPTYCHTPHICPSNISNAQLQNDASSRGDS